MGLDLGKTAHSRDVIIRFPSLILETVEWMSHSKPGGTGLEPKGEVDRKYLQTLTNLAS